MKKKIFLALLVVMVFTCLFALSVNAAGATENTYGEITTVEGEGAPSAPAVISASARTVVLSSDGTYYTIPTYYLIKDNSQFTWAPNSLVVSELGLKSGTDVRHTVVRMEIPEGVKTSVESSNGGAKFERAAELIEVSFPTSMELIGEYFFSEATKLTTVKGYEQTKVTKVYHKTFNKAPVSGIDIPSTVTEIASFAFYGTAVETYTVPDAVTELPQEVFAQCKSLKNVILSENSKLKTIGNYAFDKSTIEEFYFPSSVETLGDGAFFECESLTTIRNFANTKLTAVPYRAFCSAPLSYIEIPKNAITIGENSYKGHKAQMDKLVIPNGVTSIGKCAFAGYTNSSTTIKEVVLSASLTTLYTYAFEHNNIKVMYLPATVTSIPQGVFNNWKEDFVVVFTGTEAQLTSLLENTNNASNHNSKFVVDAAKNIKSAEAYGDVSADNITAKTIVYGYNPCKAFYNGIHDTKVERTDFAGGKYISDFCEFAKCSRCPKTEETKLIDALFVSKGYSKSEDAFMFDMKVNMEAISAYKEYYKETYGEELVLNYGLVVSGNQTLSKLLDESGDVVDNSVLKINFSESDYTNVQVRLNNIATDASKAMKVHACAYIIDSDGVAYVGEGGASEDSTLIAYDDVKGEEEAE